MAEIVRHQEVKVGDAPPDECHPGMVVEGLDVHSPASREVVDGHDVVVLCQGVGKVRADEPGAAGDDVTHEGLWLDVRSFRIRDSSFTKHPLTVG